MGKRSEMVTINLLNGSIREDQDRSMAKVRNGKTPLPKEDE
jgi:hypothetical protein